MKKFIIIFSILLTIILGSFLYLNMDPLISKPKDITTQTSKIYYIENIPVVTIYKSGYQAGYQHGELLKDQIKDVINSLNTELLKSNSVKGYLIKTYLLYKAKQLDNFIPQKYREEMKGIADAADVKYNDILLINTYDDLLYLAGCSSIAIPSSEKNQYLIHARNLDYTIDILADKNVIFNYPDSHFISVAFPGYIGALSATNLDGITISSHTSVVSENQIGIPTGILYRIAIEESSDLLELDTILNANQRTIGNNLLASSLKENTATVFEITAQKILTRTSNEYLTTTNHFVHDDYLVISDASPNSKKRYQALQNIYLYNKTITLEKVMEEMSYFDENPNGWSSLSNMGTVQSVIFIPELKTIYVAKGIKMPVTKDGYIKFEY